MPLSCARALFQATDWVCHLQPLARHAVQDERHEAAHRMRANAMGQSVIHRRNLVLGFYHPEASLNASQAFITLHDLLRGEVLYLSVT